MGFRGKRGSEKRALSLPGAQGKALNWASVFSGDGWAEWMLGRAPLVEGATAQAAKGWCEEAREVLGRGGDSSGAHERAEEGLKVGFKTKKPLC